MIVYIIQNKEKTQNMAISAVHEKQNQVDKLREQVAILKQQYEEVKNDSK